MKTDYGDIIYLRDSWDYYTTFKNRFKSYFSVVCNGECMEFEKYRTLRNGRPQNPNYFNDCIITNDGMLFCFNRGGSTQDLYIFIDVNGHKNPNKFGYDTFGFYISIDNQMLESSENWSCAMDGDNAMNGLGCVRKATYNANYFKNLP